jgi:response regulator of citrate/malate metabolism
MAYLPAYLGFAAVTALLGAWLVARWLKRQTLGMEPGAIRAALLERAMEQDRTMSAAECAESVGVSRVSARRYREFLWRLGEAQVQLRYGGTGRPQRRYLPTVGGVC